MGKKRKGLWALLLVVMFLLACVGLWWFQTFTLTVTRVEITSSKIKNTVKIVQLTDLHGASFGNDNQSLIQKIAKEKPDLVVSTGDMYTNGDDMGKETALQLLSQLAKSYPVYVVNGEHDNDDAYMEALRQNHVHVLQDQMETITVGETTLQLYGIDNVYYSPIFSLAKEFDPPKTNIFSILLAHIPNPAVFESFGVDLAISGDTHGGQVRLPWIGPLYYDGSWFPKFTYDGEIWDKGMYQIGEMELFISSGLGNYPVPIRFGNRPEIAVLTLTPD
ncbi:MAG: phosphoesterase [Clostridiales bacterium]|nr:phosphoesterase [Clostridiales bacterium]